MKRIKVFLTIVLLLFLPIIISFIGISENNTTTIKNQLHSSTITGISPPISGTWTINVDTKVENENLVINGSINVENNAKLEIINSVIIFSDESYYINVLTGILIIQSAELSNFDRIESSNNSNITIDNSNFFDYNTALRITDSIIQISDSNLTGGIRGIDIFNSDNSIIDSCNILDTQNESILVSFTNHMIIKNSKLRGAGNTYDCVGVNAGSCLNLTLNNTIIQNFHKSLFYQNVDESYVGYSNFSQTIDSMFEDGELQFADSTDNITIEYNFINNLTYDGIEIYRSKNYRIRFNTIKDIGAGTHIEHYPIENLYIYNNIFINSNLMAKDVNGLFIYNNTMCNSKIQTSNCTNLSIEDNKDECPDGIKENISGYRIEFIIVSSAILGLITIKKSTKIRIHK